MAFARRWYPILLAAAAFGLVSALPWHTNDSLRSAIALAAAVLILWASECAPLGAIALGVPVIAGLSGILSWKEAVAAWGDPNVFLFLGAFLLARAMEKFGVFDGLLFARRSEAGSTRSPLTFALLVMLLSGAISTVQNNTAVTAMLLPVVIAGARHMKPTALPLLALSFGATFGGMATPVGTAPNVIGYAAVKEVDPNYTFLVWLAVGVPAWIGCSLIGMIVLRAARPIALRLAPGPADPRSAAMTSGSHNHSESPRGPVGGYASDDLRNGRRWALAACLATAAIWLSAGFVISVAPTSHPLRAWIESRLPESLVPIAASWLLFVLPIGHQGRTVLDRHDLKHIDWDTLFLIAGGFCLGKALEKCGAASELARVVTESGLTGVWLMLALGAVTVLLSEITSNTVTAALLVPVAKALAVSAGLDPTQTIILVALCASLGFAMPISTPPNALVYGTGQIPLRLMMLVGIIVDAMCIVWVVVCVRALA
ncbi:MAG: anion permease [Phycisphaerales bacterium]|nr:anion permease [Phycisphaerales bacterium]